MGGGSGVAHPASLSIIRPIAIRIGEIILGFGGPWIDVRIGIITITSSGRKPIPIGITARIGLMGFFGDGDGIASQGP